ncbi:imidazole glycerol phosphate synthase subunit HisH [Amnibacterium flavum]|uniref:Imidazole glycerol phosphate synthase subunit HisH n=1 Tax=Amnibacterium flavum TaxID=2173173 RepID=A0A2V1HQV8_9MICO|nr:imidazole glycerol phosphate synthase subunit HisH [Amnibacterium flavum]PVZ93509.1 imidazole glycerol phosphate synthase subunit HisH [Amnibacterium flavum]
MTKPSVVVFDYGSGNVHSVVKALEAAGADVELTGDRARAQEADGLLVPGVGAFAAVMAALEGARGGELIDRRLAGGRPVLGICVGMQVMFDRGIERGEGVDGLGEWPGVVDLLRAPVLPHVGWNTIDAPKDSVLFEGLHEERFYFVHSFGAREWTLDVQRPHREPSVTWATHGEPFVAAVENGPLSATQFHPEKSGKAGIKLLENWIHSL